MWWVQYICWGGSSLSTEANLMQNNSGFCTSSAKSTADHTQAFSLPVCSWSFVLGITALQVFCKRLDQGQAPRVPFIELSSLHNGRHLNLTAASITHVIFNEVIMKSRRVKAVPRTCAFMKSVMLLAHAGANCSFLSKEAFCEQGSSQMWFALILRVFSCLWSSLMRWFSLFSSSLTCPTPLSFHSPAPWSKRYSLHLLQQRSKLSFWNLE